MSLQLLRYNPDYKEKWDEFISRSKNGTFLFFRDYMDYHSDRFVDFSLMFIDEEEIIHAVLPASIHGSEVRSHGGLTYGGLIMDETIGGGGPDSPLSMFPRIISFLKESGIDRLIYKPVPHIYHREPSEEDLYALFRLNARLIVRNLSSTIDISNPIFSGRLFKKAPKRQKSTGIEVKQTERASDFWNIINDNMLERYGVSPVHSAEELQLLRDRFPKNILFFVAELDGSPIACAVIFRDRGVLHLQYGATNALGKSKYAADIIYHDLLFNRFPKDRYFDFGINNEQDGRYLNEGLIRHKEELGGRGIIYDTYSLTF